VNDGTNPEIRTDYAGRFVYNNDELEYFLMEEGRIVEVEGIPGQYRPEYFLCDHLGDVRVVFSDTDEDGTPEILQENHYYPFGLTMGSLNYVNNTENKLKYNGKELDDGNNLRWYDYGFRRYDPQLGRWHVMDAMAERYKNNSPYNYVANNPVSFIDPNGMYMEAFMSSHWGAAAYSLLRSPYGGTYSPSGGYHEYGSDEEALEGGIDYNNNNGSWGNTSSGSASVARAVLPILIKLFSNCSSLVSFDISIRGYGLMESTLQLIPQGTAQSTGDIWYHTVKEGQNHAGICNEYYYLFNWMDIQKLNPGIDVYNGGKALPAGMVLKVPGPRSRLGHNFFDSPGVPEGKFGGVIQLAYSILLDTPHSPIYHSMTPGQFRQNRAYHNSELGYFEWSWANDNHTIMRVSNYTGYTRWKSTWRGVYQISTGLYSTAGNRIYGL